MPATSKTISAQNTFTDSVYIIGDFDLSVVASTGTVFSGTLTVQRSTDDTTWRDVGTFTASAEQVGYEPIKSYYRAGVKTGAYTAGSVTVSINGYDTWPPRI